MAPKYPNLELLEYITKCSVLASDTYKKKKAKYDTRGMRLLLEFRATVFPQMWGSANGGFDVMPDGSPAMGGSAMTEQYTTVIHERTTDVYAVFFNGAPAYMVTDATEVFYEDLKKQAMASVSESKERY